MPLTVTSEAIREALSHRTYAVLAMLTAASLAVAQISLLLMLFWASLSFQSFNAGHGIYFPPGAVLPTLVPENTLWWFNRGVIVLSISPIHFFYILLISVLTGIYLSLMVFYWKRCTAACRRQTAIGVSGFGTGGTIPIVASSAVAVGCCGLPSVTLPLVGGIGTSLLGVGLNIFGLSFTELFRTAGITILVACIYWVGSRIRLSSSHTT